MARARNIKPGFFSNEELVEVAMATRLLFIGLWTIADRDGRLENRPKRIKMQVFPADDVDIEAAIADLTERGFIIQYEANGTACIQITNWGKHQSPHVKEAASTIPAPQGYETSTVPVDANARQAPDEPDASTGQAPDKHQTSRPDSLIPDSHDSGFSDSGEVPPAAANAGEPAPPPPLPMADAKQRARRLPVTFTVSAELRQWAKDEFGFDDRAIDYETDKFRDHFGAKTDAKIDWAKAWRNWIRGSVERGRLGARPGPVPRSTLPPNAQTHDPTTPTDWLGHYATHPGIQEGAKR